jgi:uncharacterized membrane protein YeaQ/YmgE (transglycosylase-associated protein family)
MAGLIARRVMSGPDPGGTIVMILVGVAGASIGGSIVGILVGAGAAGFNGWSVLSAALGAVALLFVYDLIAHHVT